MEKDQVLRHAATWGAIEFYESLICSFMGRPNVLSPVQDHTVYKLFVHDDYLRHKSNTAFLIRKMNYHLMNSYDSDYSKVIVIDTCIEDELRWWKQSLKNSETTYYSAQCKRLFLGANRAKLHQFYAQSHHVSVEKILVSVLGMMDATLHMDEFLSDAPFSCCFPITECFVYEGLAVLYTVLKRGKVKFESFEEQLASIRSQLRILRSKQGKWTQTLIELINSIVTLLEDKWQLVQPLDVKEYRDELLVDPMTPLSNELSQFLNPFEFSAGWM